MVYEAYMVRMVREESSGGLGGQEGRTGIGDPEALGGQENPGGLGQEGPEGWEGSGSL